MKSREIAAATRMGNPFSGIMTGYVKTASKKKKKKRRRAIMANNQSTTDLNQLSIHTALTDEDDYTYQLAGVLLGTEWQFPDGPQIYEVTKITQSKETHSGKDVYAVQLSFEGQRTRSASDFITNAMAGNVTPCNLLAEKFVAEVR